LLGVAAAAAAVAKKKRRSGKQQNEHTKGAEGNDSQRSSGDEGNGSSSSSDSKEEGEREKQGKAATKNGSRIAKSGDGHSSDPHSGITIGNRRSSDYAVRQNSEPKEGCSGAYHSRNNGQNDSSKCSKRDLMTGTSMEFSIDEQERIIKHLEEEDTLSLCRRCSRAL
jgi:hypothetical protein